MTALSHAIPRVAAAALAAMVVRSFVQPATAQRAPDDDLLVLVIQSIEGVGRRERVPTPQYRTSIPERRPAVRGEWGRITTKYDTSPEWIDNLIFEYFALLVREERGEPPQYTLFRGTVTYMDIEQGRDKESTAFLRPSTLRRYGEMIGIAVEIRHEGDVVAVESQELRGSVAEGQEEWWRNPNLTPRDGYILNRSETPFAFINYDLYEAISQ